MTARLALSVLALVSLPGVLFVSAFSGGWALTLVTLTLVVVLTAYCRASVREPVQGADLLVAPVLALLTGVGTFYTAIFIGIATEVIPFMSIEPGPYEDVWTAGSIAVAVAAGVAVLVLSLRRSPAAAESAQASLASQ